MISAGRMHLYLALLHHRDYFVPSGCISILLFFTTGIISAARMHLYLALLLHRDYFRRSDASLSCSFSPQGLFRPFRFISILLFSSTGIISAARMHLYLALLLHRDYFCRPNASLSCSFAPQRLLNSCGYQKCNIFIDFWVVCDTKLQKALLRRKPAEILRTGSDSLWMLPRMYFQSCQGSCP